MTISQCSEISLTPAYTTARLHTRILVQCLPSELVICFNILSCSYDIPSLPCRTGIDYFSLFYKVLDPLVSIICYIFQMSLHLKCVATCNTQSFRLARQWRRRWKSTNHQPVPWRTKSTWTTKTWQRWRNTSIHGQSCPYVLFKYSTFSNYYCTLLTILLIPKMPRITIVAG